MTEKRKLIEVALPLEAINGESAREKSIRHGHPSTLHMWWARRPLAACRAVLFASLVNDPSTNPDRFPTEESQDAERQRLFQIIGELVKWQNVNNETVLRTARHEIEQACGGTPPIIVDPFCGGGSIPLEAQRLGLETHSGDLNPVPVLITKALVEIPPKFNGLGPVHPDDDKGGLLGSWTGPRGLADDVRYYGQWIREAAWKRVGHLYPKVALTSAHGPGEAVVAAWIWARTVQSPNPAWDAPVPLARSFSISAKKGKEIWIQPIVDPKERRVRFEIGRGAGMPGGTVRRGGATCFATGTPIPLSYIKEQGTTGRMGIQLMAIVATNERGKTYLAPSAEHEDLVLGLEEPTDFPEFELSTHPQYMGPPRYGLTSNRKLFTPRQQLALVAFSDLVQEARGVIHSDALSRGLPDDDKPLSRGGTGAAAYADAISTFLALGVGRCCDYWTSLTNWVPSGEFVGHTFTRQAIPMVWDFAECNPFGNAGGDWDGAIDWIARVVDKLPASVPALVEQQDATKLPTDAPVVIATDPPYYDNVPYADLADFFYVWLRRALREVWPAELSTLLVPKAEELVADVQRYGSREAAQHRFEAGMTEVFRRFSLAQDPRYPMTVIYGFKQSEDGGAGQVSRGWETILEAMIRSGLTIDGTWPIRSERPGRMRELGSNVLASSIVLVCRSRPNDAPLATRRDFLAALGSQLPIALRYLQQGNIAPVDLAQAAIGPGMAVFSRYSRVVEADGSAMPVRAALGLINQVLDETLSEQEADFDSDTRWAVAWFEQFGMNPGAFGVAETLSKAKNTAINGLVAAGILESRAGKVRLLDRAELPNAWDPAADARLTVWELAQHLIRALESGGENEAADLLRRIGGLGETARELAYRLYVICERKKWAKEALAYNALVVAWPEISRLAASVPAPSGPAQQELL